MQLLQASSIMILDLKKIGTAEMGKISTDFLEKQTIFYFAERLGQALPESVRSSQNKIKLSHLNHFSPEKEILCSNKNIYLEISGRLLK